MSGTTDRKGPQYRRLLTGPLILLALVITVRFVLEAAGVPLDTTRFLSATVVSALAIVYLGAVAPLRGLTRFRQLSVPAFLLSAWLGGWTALVLMISGVFQLPGSHFAHVAPEPLYPRLWFHVVEHIAVIPFASIATMGVMAIPYSLHRWPVAVGPGTLLGALVVLRFSAEAMNLAPALVLGWVWRLWILLAAFVSAALRYETHFFDPTQFRLLQFLGVEVIVVGFAAGLLVWGIALWVSRATRPLAEA
jgi:hypothetical protein